MHWAELKCFINNLQRLNHTGLYPIKYFGGQNKSALLKTKTENSLRRVDNQLGKSHMTQGWNETRTTLLEDETYHHCASPSTQCQWLQDKTATANMITINTSEPWKKFTLSTLIDVRSLENPSQMINSASPWNEFLTLLLL